MCQPTKAEAKPPTRPPSGDWRSVLLPLLAGFLHLHVFYRAAYRCAYRTYDGSTSSSSTDEYLDEIYRIDRAVFVAYAFDLLCCRWGVIPFSRCHTSGDIVGHHLPTLLLALPLAVPLWRSVRWLEPTSLAILDLDVGDELRHRFLNAYALATGFAYASSLNEVFMCFQRVEMSWQGCARFRDVPRMRHGFFTSRIAVGCELGYKLCFFWGISWMACKACCDFDRTLYDHAAATAGEEASAGGGLLAVYTSPAVLRALLFRVFSIVMYPSMGARCLKKIKQFRQEGKGVTTKVT